LALAPAAKALDAAAGRSQGSFGNPGLGLGGVEGLFHHAMPEGAQVPVIYLPEDPTVLEFERGETKGEAGVFRWLGIGLAALGGLLAVAGLVLRRRAAA
jgi:hypothetical protein